MAGQAPMLRMLARVLELAREHHCRAPVRAVRVAQEEPFAFELVEHGPCVVEADVEQPRDLRQRDGQTGHGEEFAPESKRVEVDGVAKNDHTGTPFRSD